MSSRIWNLLLGSAFGITLSLGAFWFWQHNVGKNFDQSLPSQDSESSMFSINGKTITTPYGVFEVQDPVIFALLQSAAMQRIKNIQQYGPMSWIKKSPYFSRYSHCLGVWAVLRRFRASLNEQISGLLHDVSHTVFSHLGDHIFNHGSMLSSYQDEIHEWFLRKYGIDRILATYNIELKDILHKNGNFKALESDLPDLCADRIEYNLRGGLVEGLLELQDIEPILSALRWDNERWYFVDPTLAAKFSRVSLYLTEHEWGSPSNGVVSSWMVKAIRRAFELQIITLDEIHFSIDDIIWGRLIASTDPVIKKFMNKSLHYKDQFKFVSNTSDADKIVRSKFRGVNPWILEKGQFKRLTDVDAPYAKEYERVKNLVKIGWNIRFYDREDVAEESDFQGV